MSPWILAEYSTNARLSRRNPYYWKVDEAGNQLPYIDTVMAQTVDAETYQLKITGGEADYAWCAASFDNIRSHKDPALRETFDDIRFRRAV